MYRALRYFVNQQSWLQSLGTPLQKIVNEWYTADGEESSRKQLQNFLNGVWLGHPLHAMLTDVPVGAWTATMALDTVGGLSGNEGLQGAADLTLATGLAAAIPTVASGLTDWMDTYGDEMTFGLLHGLVMSSSVLLYSMSLLTRLAGARGAGVALSNLGYAVMAAGAYVGGDEVYEFGYPVNHTAFQHGPGKFTPVLKESELQPDTLTKADAGGVPVLLVKEGSQIYALDDTCVHAGCSLAGGSLKGTVVTCPCHGSQYDIRDGSVLNGPATMPEPAYDVRVENGMVEVKARGSH